MSAPHPSIAHALAIALLALSSHASAQDAAPAPVHAVSQYVTATRDWSPAEYSVEALHPEPGVAHLLSYRVTPLDTLRQRSALNRTFDLYLDAQTGQVVGERVVDAGSGRQASLPRD